MKKKLILILSLVVFFNLLIYASEKRMVETIISAVPLYAKATDSMPPIMMLANKQKLEVYYSCADDSGKIWFCLNIKSNKKDTGYGMASYFKYISNKEEEKTPIQLTRDIKKDKARRFSALRKNQDWSMRIKNAVRKGEIVLYMSQEQLVASWGEPEKHSKSFMVGIGNFEVYFYTNKETKFNIGVFVSDNRVTGWTD